MQKKIKNIVVTSVFVAFIAFFVAMCIVSYLNPVASSESERRPLAQFPSELTWESVVDKSFIDKFEDYSVDQFPFREFFRSLKANFQYHVMGLKENNGLAIEDGYIAKVEDGFNDKLINNSLKKLTNIYNTHLKDKAANTYVAIIPEKGYFLGRDYGYISPDYDKLIADVQAALPEMEYIDIMSELELDDYYRTDTHWSQDKILGVLDKLAEAMDFADRLPEDYTENNLGDFKGVYHGQSGLNPEPDDLVYLTNNVIDSFRVFDYETNRYGVVYDESKLDGADRYEYFLSGTRALLRIDNPRAQTDKTLVVFRDSFGSSISPLIAQGYKSVYVVDIRYVAPQILGNYIDFEGVDVLYLYSTLVLNSNSFK